MRSSANFILCSVLLTPDFHFPGNISFSGQRAEPVTLQILTLCSISSTFLDLSVIASKRTEALPRISQACVCASLSTQAAVPVCRIKLFQGWISHHLSILCGAVRHPGDLSLRACFHHMSLLSDQLCQDIWEKMTKSSWKTLSEFQRSFAKLVFANNFTSTDFCLSRNDKCPLPKGTKQFIRWCACPPMARTHGLFAKPRDSGMMHLQEEYKDLLQKNCNLYAS